MNNLSSLLFSSPSSSPLSVHANRKMFESVKVTFKMRDNLAAADEKKFIESTAMPTNDITLVDFLNSMERLDSTVEPDIKTFLLRFNSHIDRSTDKVMQHFFERIIVFLQNEKAIWTQNIDDHAVLCEIKVRGMDLKKLIKYENDRFSNNHNLEEPIPSLVTYFNSLISPQPLLNRKVIACFVIILASFAGFAGYVARGAIASRYGNPFPDFSNRNTNNYSNIINDTKRITFDSSYVAEPWLPPKLSVDPKIFREGFNFIAQFDGKKFELKARGFQKIYNFFSNENHKIYSLVNAQDMINNKLLKSNENRGRSYVKVTSDFSNEALHHSKFRLWVEFRDFGNKDYRNVLRRRKKDVKQNLSKGVKDVKDVLKRNNYRVYGGLVFKVFEPGNTILDACGYKNESKCILKEKKEQNVKNIS